MALTTSHHRGETIVTRPTHTAVVAVLNKRVMKDASRDRERACALTLRRAHIYPLVCYFSFFYRYCTHAYRHTHTHTHTHTHIYIYYCKLARCALFVLHRYLLFTFTLANCNTMAARVRARIAVNCASKRQTTLLHFGVRRQ